MNKLVYLLALLILPITAIWAQNESSNNSSSSSSSDNKEADKTGDNKNKKDSTDIQDEITSSSSFEDEGDDEVFSLEDSDDLSY